MEEGEGKGGHVGGKYHFIARRPLSPAARLKRGGEKGREGKRE